MWWIFILIALIAALLLFAGYKRHKRNKKLLAVSPEDDDVWWIIAGKKDTDSDEVSESDPLSGVEQRLADQSAQETQLDVERLARELAERDAALQAGEEDVDDVVAAGEESRRADADLDAAELEMFELEEEANQPGANRDAYDPKLKAQKVRLELARERAERAAKRLRELRLGNSLLKSRATEVALAVARARGIADVDLDEAGLELQALEEAANQPGADREAYTVDLRRAKLRLELARLRAERAAKRLHELRIGSSLVERDSVERALAVDAALTADEEERLTDADAKAEELALSALEEEANRPGANFDAYDPKLKAQKVRLELARERAERAAKRLRELRVGNSIFEREAVLAALAAVEACRSADADVKAAGLEINTLEKEANKPGSDRAAYAANLKQQKVRLELARERSERAAKRLRELRIGNSLLERGAMEAALAADAAVAAAKVTQSADADVEAEEFAFKTLEEEANQPGADRDAYDPKLKAQKVRLELARERAERAAKRLRELRLGNSILEREVVAAALAVEAALTAAEASRVADIEVKQAEDETRRLVEQANNPGADVDRDAYTAKLKQQKLRLVLAQQRAERVSKRLRDVRHCPPPFSL